MGGTIRVEESVGIARPPAEVWSAIADYGFDREWRNGLREMTPDPAGGMRVLGPLLGPIVRSGLKKDLLKLKTLLEGER
jgi:hypothetical protein